MLSSQTGLCPVCRVFVQVKNFKRHWNTQHQRHEKKRTYDEVFNTLKVNISYQDKTKTTSSIDTFFESKRRRISEDAQVESMTTIIQQNFVFDDCGQSFDALSPSLLNPDIYLRKSNNSYDDDMLVRPQIFEDIFAQLENEKHVIHTSFVMDENDGITLTNSSIIDIISHDIIENENINDNDDDVLMSLNDLITRIIDHDTIQNKNFNENDDTIPFINSINNK